MAVFAGTVLLHDRSEAGWLQTDEGRVTDFGLDDEPPEKPMATGWICPPPVNAHTHVADAFLRDAPGKPTDVASLVGPGGFKHRHLATARPNQLVEGILHYTDEMAAIGTSHFIDFREGGLDGSLLLDGLRHEAASTPVIYGRPARNTFDEDEANALLERVDGIGLSGVRDFERQRDIDAWAEACHDAKRPWAIHLSEDRRDDAERIAALAPRFVVHCTKANKQDFRILAEHDIPIVACPRSNRFFGLKTPLPAMQEAGCTVALGTDNGMLQDGDLLQEAARLKAWFPSTQTDELLRMMTWNGRQLLKLPPVLPAATGTPLDHVVLPPNPLPPAPDDRPGWTAPSAATDAGSHEPQRQPRAES